MKKTGSKFVAPGSLRLKSNKRPMSFNSFSTTSNQSKNNCIPPSLEPVNGPPRVTTEPAIIEEVQQLEANMSSDDYHEETMDMTNDEQVNDGDSLKDPVAIERHERMKKKLEENPNATTIDLVEVAFGKQNHGKVAGLGGGVKPKDINGKSSKNEELLAKLRRVEEEKASLQKRVEDNEVAARAEAERQKQATDELKAEMDEMKALLRAMCNQQQM
ncbi:hypothetical protein LINPERPRIM_LOCUS13067 [Linum perenne]